MDNTQLILMLIYFSFYNAVTRPNCASDMLFDHGFILQSKLQGVG
jgi:hypothetical protein